MRVVCLKELSFPDKMSSTPVHPAWTTNADVTPLRAVMPPKWNAFWMWSVSRFHAPRPED